MWWDKARAPGRPPGKPSIPDAGVTPRAAAAKPKNGPPGRSFISVFCNDKEITIINYLFKSESDFLSK